MSSNIVHATTPCGGNFIRNSFTAQARFSGRRPFPWLVLRTANMPPEIKNQHHPRHGPSGLVHVDDERHEEVVQLVVWWWLLLLLLWLVVLLTTIMMVIAKVDVEWS